MTIDTTELTLDEALQQAVMVLGAGSDARHDAEILLCHVLNCSPVKLLTGSAQMLTAKQQSHFQQLLTARQTGQPIAYLLGWRGFWDLELTVTTDTLIPRPDTELLVTLALAKMPASARCADLGTGSGAIALTLAKQRPDTFWLASDFSMPALKVARNNALVNQIGNVIFVCSDWTAMLAANSLDLLVSNPPYIADTDPHLLQGDLRFEPHTALAAGPDGLDDIRQIIEQAGRVLKPGGWLMIEHGWQQSAAVQALFSQASFQDVSGHRDFGGKDRVVIGRRPLSGKISV